MFRKNLEVVGRFVNRRRFKRQLDKVYGRKEAKVKTIFYGICFGIAITVLFIREYFRNEM